jgi:hypothetical protein
MAPVSSPNLFSYLLALKSAWSDWLRRIPQMQVGRVKLTGLLQFIPVFDDDLFAGYADYAAAPQLLQSPVHMHC